MKVLSVIIGALLLGSVLGAAWSAVEYRDPGDDLRAMVDRLHDPARLSTATREPGTPHVVVENGNEFDFGVMDLNEALTHTFVLRNEGDAPLTLELLGTTCKCAIGTLPDGAIPPGGEGEVTLEWTAKAEGTDYRQSATIQTNDPLQEVLYLSVMGKVTQILRAIPRSVIFTDIPTTEPRSASFELLNFKEDQFEIADFSWEDLGVADFLELTYQPMSSDELANAYGALSGYRCTVTVQPGLPMGAFRNLLTLQLTPGDRRSLSVPVRGNVVTDIRIAGAGYRDRLNRLELGMVSREGTSRQLMILAKGPHRDQLEFEVAAIEPPDILEVTVGEGKPLNNGAVWKFPLQIKVLPTEGIISHLVSSDQEPARVLLETNHPDAEQIEVFVSFAVGSDR